MTIGVPFLLALLIACVLHLLGRILIVSLPRRSRYLFEGTPWLPLRRHRPLLGEEVEFSSSDKIVLRGTFLARKGSEYKGTVLFCHELNGTRANIAPYVDELTEAGFNLLAFDFRNHGQSDSCRQGRAGSTPWVTTTDLNDVMAALNYLYSRSDVDDSKVSLFGLGKGATIALCAAGHESRIQSVILDTPQADNRLYEKNCWQAMVKSTRLTRRSSARFTSMLARTILYSVSCPVVSLMTSWRRFVLGFWFDCRFIDPSAFIKRIRQPIMIVHGHLDSGARADQIQALGDHLPIRPELWLVSSKHRDTQAGLTEECSRQVARFLEGV